jgi:hypothetical protein
MGLKSWMRGLFQDPRVEGKIKNQESTIALLQEETEQLKKELETLKTPKPAETEKIITFKDIQKGTSDIANSTEAVDYVSHMMELRGIKIIDKIKVDAGTWKSYILYTPEGGYLVTFKINWLYSYGKIFNQPEPEGTGLNLHMAKYCQVNGVQTLLIVRGDRKIYSIDINELIEYATTHNTIRQEKESFEAHIPINLLKTYPANNNNLYK